MICIIILVNTNTNTYIYKYIHIRTYVHTYILFFRCRAGAVALQAALGATDLVGYGGFLAASTGRDSLRLLTKRW